MSSDPIEPIESRIRLKKEKEIHADTVRYYREWPNAERPLLKFQRPDRFFFFQNAPKTKTNSFRNFPKMKTRVFLVLVFSA